MKSTKIILGALLCSGAVYAGTPSGDSNTQKSPSSSAGQKPSIGPIPPSIYIPPPPTPEQLRTQAEIDKQMKEIQDTYRRFVEQSSIRNFKTPPHMERQSPVEKTLNDHLEKTNPQEFGRGSDLAGQKAGIQTKGDVSGVRVYGGSSAVYSGGSSVDGTGTVLIPGNTRGSTKETQIEGGIQIRLPDSTGAPVQSRRHSDQPSSVNPVQSALQGAQEATAGIPIDPSKKASKEAKLPEK